MNDKLLPCPFCGVMPAPMSIGLRGGQHYYIQCQNLDCQIRDVSTKRNDGDTTTAEEAIERWNRRAVQPQYREPTLEDARELSKAIANVDEGVFAPPSELLLQGIKRLGFGRKTQP